MDLMFIAVVTVFALSILVFGLVAFFFPEWVGITGKVAKQNEADHRGEND